MRIFLIGAGNLGLVCAAKMAAHGDQVALFTGTPDKWTDVAAAEDFQGNRFEGKFSTVTNDASLAKDSDVILLCLPGNAIKQKLEMILPYLAKKVPIVSIFSGDGFFFIAEDVLSDKWPVMGFQRVPFISRTKIPYRLGGITGYKKELFLAHRNVDNPNLWREYFALVFNTPTTLLNNFYDAALINGNAVMHPARLMSLQAQIEKFGPFKKMPLFYEEWDDIASDWAIRLDKEVCAVAKARGAHITPFLEYYESTDIASLTRKIRSIPAFHGIGSPITSEGYIDRTSRYIQADIYLALRGIVGIAKKNLIAMPISDSILKAFDN